MSTSSLTSCLSITILTPRPFVGVAVAPPSSENAGNYRGAVQLPSPCRGYSETDCRRRFLSPILRRFVALRRRIGVRKRLLQLASSETDLPRVGRGLQFRREAVDWPAASSLMEGNKRWMLSSFRGVCSLPSSALLVLPLFRHRRLRPRDRGCGRDFARRGRIRNGRRRGPLALSRARPKEPRRTAIARRRPKRNTRGLKPSTRVIRTTPSRFSAGRFNSIRNMPPPTVTAASPWSSKGTLTRP